MDSEEEVFTTTTNNRRRTKIMTMGGNDRQRRCSHRHEMDERVGIIPPGVCSSNNITQSTSVKINSTSIGGEMSRFYVGTN